MVATRSTRGSTCDATCDRRGHDVPWVGRHPLSGDTTYVTSPCTASIPASNVAPTTWSNPWLTLFLSVSYVNGHASQSPVLLDDPACSSPPSSLASRRRSPFAMPHCHCAPIDSCASRRNRLSVVRCASKDLRFRSSRDVSDAMHPRATTCVRTRLRAWIEAPAPNTTTRPHGGAGRGPQRCSGTSERRQARWPLGLPLERHRPWRAPRQVRCPCTPGRWHPCIITIGGTPPRATTSSESRRG